MLVVVKCQFLRKNRVMAVLSPVVFLLMALNGLTDGISQFYTVRDLITTVLAWAKRRYICINLEIAQMENANTK